MQNDTSWKYTTATIFIISGSLLILLAVYLEHFSHSFGAEIGVGLISHFGIGSLVIGVLGILIDMNHWTDYFKKRLAEIVMEKKYMENLTPEALINLQSEVLKVYFKDKNIVGEEGFLKYYQTHIQAIIGSPFRTNLDADLRIDYDADNDKMVIYEEICWNCKINGGKIQDQVSWLPEDDEFESVRNLAIRIEHDSFGVAASKKRELYYTWQEFKEEWKCANGLGFTMPLEEYCFLDGLKITVIAEYVLSSNRFMAWRMAHPTRGLSLTIRYPDTMLIAVETYSMGSYSFNIKNNEPGYYKITSAEWILPDEGVAFQIYQK